MVVLTHLNWEISARKVLLYLPNLVMAEKSQSATDKIYSESGLTQDYTELVEFTRAN